jgi:hypothetical protein
MTSAKIELERRHSRLRAAIVSALSKKLPLRSYPIDSQFS